LAPDDGLGQRLLRSLDCLVQVRQGGHGENRAAHAGVTEDPAQRRERRPAGLTRETAEPPARERGHRQELTSLGGDFV
jgi:hypothetical protein